MANNINIFVSYAQADQILLQKLEKHLSLLKRQHAISIWNDRNISGGEEWQVEIDQHLKDAQIILLLISPDFLASDYIYSQEMKSAIKLFDEGKARIIPIILRPTDWQGTSSLGKFQALPTGGIPVTLWKSEDEAVLNVAHGIRKTIQALETKTSTVQPTKSATIAVPSSKNQPSSEENTAPALSTDYRVRLDFLAQKIRHVNETIQEAERDLQRSDNEKRRENAQQSIFHQQQVMKDFLREYLERADESGVIVPTDIIQISAKFSDTDSTNVSSYDNIQHALSTLSARELRLLELDLDVDVDIDILVGDNAMTKINSLIDYMRQHGQIDELEAYLKRKRPSVFISHDTP